MRCIVKDCANHAHQGLFVGSLCNPCHAFITTGVGKYSQAYRNTQRKPLTDKQRDHIASLRGSYSAAYGEWIFTPKELTELFDAIEAAHGIKGKHELY
jgi:hypothetical protein